jgi:hypothetical protein
MDPERTSTYVASNPRLMGVLYAILLLLSQSGTAAAGCGIISGP